MLWIILATLGLSVCTVVATSRLPNIYRAETVILVDSQQVPDKYVPDVIPGDIAGRLTTVQQQVLSPTRLKTLVESEGLYPDPTGKLSEKQVITSTQKSIVVELINPGAGKLGSFRIQYSGQNRSIVAPIANRLAQMFIDENMSAREGQTADTAEFLESQLAETKKELDDKDAQLQAIKARNIMDLPESKPYHLEALANLRGQVTTIQNKIQDDQREKSIVQSMLSSTIDAPTIDVDGTAVGGGPTGPFDAQLQKLESKLSELRSHYGPGHPDVRRTQNEINKLKAKMAAAAADPTNAQAVEDSRPAIQPSPLRHNPVLEAQISQLDEEMRGQTNLLGPLQEQIEFHTTKLQQMPVFEQQLGRLQQDYDIIKGQYKDLQDKEQAAKISHALEVHQKGDRFVVLDEATTPESPAAPNRLLINLAGLVGGLLAGIVLAAIAEVNDKSVRTGKEAAKIFGRPVLTETPLVTSEPERRSRFIRLAGVLVGTAAGSAALGFIVPIVVGRFF
ncbi:MAG: hypothetical protein LAN36_08705 [Acidobacteriia bacterium]|nr:hypothetical protein [Terriglobia bacterium]